LRSLRSLYPALGDFHEEIFQACIMGVEFENWESGADQTLQQSGLRLVVAFKVELVSSGITCVMNF
jgi:hypothetical protein